MFYGSRQQHISYQSCDVSYQNKTGRISTSRGIDNELFYAMVNFPWLSYHVTSVVGPEQLPKCGPLESSAPLNEPAAIATPSICNVPRRDIRQDDPPTNPFFAASCVVDCLLYTHRHDDARPRRMGCSPPVAAPATRRRVAHPDRHIFHEPVETGERGASEEPSRRFSSGPRIHQLVQLTPRDRRDELRGHSPVKSFQRE